MRQVSIKELGKHLSAEMANLPFAVMKRGKFIGAMVAPGITQGTDLVLEGTDNKPKTTPKGTDKLKTAKEQLTNIIKKKQKVLTPKAAISTAKTPAFGYPKNKQTGKK